MLRVSPSFGLLLEKGDKLQWRIQPVWNLRERTGTLGMYGQVR